MVQMLSRKTGHGSGCQWWTGRARFSWQAVSRERGKHDSGILGPVLLLRDRDHDLGA